MLLGEVAIIGAALLVGIAILTEGTTSRALNGLGAVVWVSGTVMLLVALRHEPWAGLSFSVAAVAGIGLAIIVRPSDLTAAVIGFGVAGAAVGLMAATRPVGWALLVPGIYLPVHLSVAITRSLIAGGGTIRTEPPPTAPLVPLAMVLAAGIAGLVASRLRGGKL